MPSTCSKCGNTIKDGEKFCTSCGTPVVAVKVTTSNRYCRQCGNLLSEGAKFCDVCGKEAPKEKKKEEPVVEEHAEMEGIVSPVITEDTFAGAREMNRERYDGFEAAEMPGSAPASPQTPPPAPSFEMDSAAVSQPKPEPQPAPQPQQPPRQQVTVQSIQQSNPYGQYGARQTTGAPMPTQNQQPQTPPPVQTSPPVQPQQPYYDQQPSAPMPQSMPQQNADNSKKNSMTVPVILAVIIVIILVVDAVVFLGKGRSDKGEDKKDCAQIVLADEICAENAENELIV